MAKIEDLFAALKAADAAGNTEDASKIAQYLNSLGFGPQQEAAPPKKETGFKDYLKDIPKAVGRGATGLLETSAIGASALLPEDYEKSVRAGIESLAKPTREYLAPATPEIGESISSKLLSGVGSTAPFFVMGPLGLAGRLGATALGTAAAAGEARQGAEQAGATPEERSKATMLGAPVGLLDIIAPNIGPLKSIFTTALARGGVEGLTEAAQKVAQNYIAKGVYDPKKDVLEGSGEEGVYGAGVGALTSLLVDLTLGRRAKGAVTPPPERPPTAVAAPEAVALPPVEPPVPTFGPQPPFSVEAENRRAEELYRQEQLRQQAEEQRRADEATLAEAMKVARQEQIAQMPGFTGADGNVAIGEEMRKRRQQQEAEAEQRAQAEAQAAEQQRRQQAAEAEQERLRRIDEIRNTTYSNVPRVNERIKQQLLDELRVEPQEPAGLFPKGEPVEKEPLTPPKKVGRFKYAPEDQEQIDSLKAEIGETTKLITAAKKQKGNLFKELEGKLTDRPGAINLSDIDPDNKKLKKLYNRSGTGAVLEDMVADGKLDSFLPAGNRSDNPDFDAQAATEHIIGKLRTGDYTSEIESAEIEAAERRRDQAQQQLDKLTSLPEVTAELETTARRRPFVAPKTAEDLTKQTIAEPVDFEGLIEQAQIAGVDVERVKKDIARQMPEATQAQYAGALYNTLSAAVSESAPFTIDGRNYTRTEIETLIGERFTEDEINDLIAQAEAKQKPTPQPPAPPKTGGKTVAPPGGEGRVATTEEVSIPAAARKNAALSEAVEDNDWDRVTNALSSSANPLIANVGRMAKDLFGITTEIKPALFVGKRKNWLGFYRPIEGSIYVKNKSYAANEWVVAHETVHALTLNAINNPTQAQRPSVNRLNNLYRFVKTKLGARGRSMYGLTNIKEFIAEGNANPEFQKELSKIAYQNKTAWGAFTQNIANLLGIKNESALTELIALTEEMTSTESQTGKPSKEEAPLIGKKEKAPTLTKVGSDALDMLDGIGRQEPKPEPGYIEKVRQSWDNARDNPQATREAAYGAFRKFADQVETWSFSSDAALNNQISREVMSSMIGNEQKIGMLLNTSLSQTAHSDAVANLFLMEGNIKYDTELNKWVGVKDDNNIFNLSKKLDEIAQENGLNKEQIERISHTAFEARRTQELNEFNEKIDAQVEAMRAEAATMRAEGKPVAASALSDKAQKLISKRKNTRNMRPEEIQIGLQFFEMFPKLSEVTAIWNGIRGNAIDVMVNTGLYTQEEADMLMDAAGYVPFFREEQIEEGKGPKEFLRSLSVQADKGLKGSDKKVNDIFDNMVRWTQYAINRGVRNRSAVALATTAEQVGLANKIHNKSNPDNVGIGFDAQGNPMLEKVSGQGVIPFNTPQQASQARATQESLKDYSVLGIEVEENGQKVKRYVLAPPMPAENLVYVWQDGERVGYSMADPLFMSAFRGLESVSIPTIKVFSKMADVLRQSVVLYPLFSIAQVPQDSFAAMFTSGLKPQYALSIPFRAVKEFIQTLRGKSKAHEELKNIGAVGVRDFTSAVIRADAEIFAGLKQDKSFWAGVKRKLGNLAMAADNAVRQATFEAAEAQGLSKAEAYEKAFEIFNVRRRGNSKMLALAGQVIPFFNAYLAAQHVAYRTLTGVGTSPTERKAAFQTLAATTGSVMALSVLYAMMNGDDEDYLNKPTPTRDRLLMIPGSGGFSIPLRADIFALPKVLAEHTYLLLTDNGYQDSAKFRSSIASLLANSIFSPTPVPQAIKPLAEAIINFDFFQQKPLVGVFQQRKDLSRQFEASTSEFSKLLGQTEMISPIVADHLIRGMFGSFGGLFLYMTNPILAEMSGKPRPALSFQDALATIPNASGFVSKEYESALRKDFYALQEATGRAALTLSDLKRNSPQDVADYLSDETTRQRINLAPFVNNIATKLTDIRNSRNVISQLPEDKMDEDEKQARIKKLLEDERKLLQGVNLKKLREMANL